MQVFRFFGHASLTILETSKQASVRSSWSFGHSKCAALNVLRIDQTKWTCAFVRLSDMSGRSSCKAIWDASVRVSLFFRHAWFQRAKLEGSPLRKRSFDSSRNPSVERLRDELKERLCRLISGRLLCLETNNKTSEPFSFFSYFPGWRVR